MKKRARSIDEDKRVKRLLSDVCSGNMSIDVNASLDEMETIHRSRMVRSLKTKSLFGVGGAQKIAEVIQQNQANRSRVVEIKLGALRRRMLLEERLELTATYLRVKYSNNLSEYRTVGERSSVIDSLLEPVNKLVSELSRVEEYADIVLEDMDKAGWSLKNLEDAMSIEMRG